MSRMSFLEKKDHLGAYRIIKMQTCSGLSQRYAHFRCDERFVGYGGNKAACLYEMYLSGMSFYVLADHFLVHQSHAYEEAARRLEVRCFSWNGTEPYFPRMQRKNNRKIYQEFKEEACLR
jgi:hypothetical protein